MSSRILVIDDDIMLQQNMVEILSSLGYKVDVASETLEGLQKAYQTQPDLIILDVMLPGLDGWQACKRFREMSNVPIIMLSALGSEEYVIKGLNMGADDYLVKPVTLQLLEARIKAILRRSTQYTDRDVFEMAEIIQHDDLIIDLDKHLVTRKNKRIDLSPTEFRLLTCLAKHQGRVLSHDFLLTQVWGPEYVGELDHLRLYISYLRKKIEDDSSTPQLIQNEWGIGYRFS